MYNDKICEKAKLLKLLDDIEVLVRSGQINDAAKSIKGIKMKQVERSNFWRVANLAQRCGLPMFALRALYPLIYGEKSEIRAPSGKELLEYGFSLLMVGASGESKKIFNKIDSEKEKRVELYHAYACITEWNYSEAAQFLNTYIDGFSEEKPYQLYVAYLNLALSQFYSGKVSKALETVTELIDLLDDSEHSFLKANSHELLGQILIEKENNLKAKKELLRAQNLLGNQNSVFNLFIRKSLAIILASEKGGAKASDEFKKIRSEALKTQQWEIVRQIDFLTSKFSDDQVKFLNIYFSTPHENYRKYMLDQFSRSSSIPETFHIHSPSNGTQEKSMIFDLASGGLKGKKCVFEPGRVEHRLLSSLLKDLYKPRRIATLHSEIYPDEYFNPHSSPLKIHQAVRRARKKIKEHNLPLEISETDGSYSIQIKRGARVQVSSETGAKTSHDHRIIQLRMNFEGDCFSAKDAAETLDLSLRSATYVLKKEVGRSIRRVGSGPLIKYKFVS